jgi:hypothetical protein
MSARDYILQSIVEPNAYLAPECPNGPCLANIMPRDYGHRLTVDQQDQLVAYLLEQQQEPSAVAEDIHDSFRPGPGSETAPAEQPTSVSRRDINNVRIVSVLLVTLALLISLIVYFRDKPAKK